MRVITWNCRRATAGSHAWDYVRELDPDIALLQEVAGFPSVVERDWSIARLSAATKGGGVQRFSTAVLVRGEIDETFSLSSRTAWVQAELTRFAGNLVGCRIRLDGEAVNLVSVYSPAWPVDRLRLNGVDTSDVRLAQNPDVWLTDVLLAALREMEPRSRGPWIIGGDLNLSETFDSLQGRPRGNLEYLERMSAFGLTECLRHATGAVTPTFRNASDGRIVHQMDHLFVSQPLAACLAWCRVGSPDRVFDGRLSDHLPIIAEFMVR